MTRFVLTWITLAAVVCTLAAPAAAQEYPTRPVEIVVGFAPGGGADVAARLMATHATRKWGTPVNVVNQPGASGITATRQVLSARPDGHTLFLDVHAVSSMLFAVQSEVPFKLEEKTPIALVTLDPVIYTVKADSPWKSLRDVADAAKASPKSFRYALGGVAAVAAFSVSQFLYAAGVPVPETNKVVFAGGAPALAALAGGHVDFAGQQWSEVTPLLGGGKIRALAVVHATRLPSLPDVPTAKEAGFPDLNVVGWQGLSGPPRLPAHVVQKWTALLEAASKEREFLEQAEKVSKVIVYKGPQEFMQFQQDELRKYLPMATQMGIRK
jgi:tripartite-type tricarboxylate transporter receptor subunit TctC